MSCIVTEGEENQPVPQQCTSSVKSKTQAAYPATSEQEESQSRWPCTNGGTFVLLAEQEQLEAAVEPPSPDGHLHLGRTVTDHSVDGTVRGGDGKRQCDNLPRKYALMPCILLSMHMGNVSARGLLLTGSKATSRAMTRTTQRTSPLVLAKRECANFRRE